MTDDASHIAAEFPPVSADDWRALAEASLKGEPLESLTRKTADGIVRGPVFFRGDAPEDGASGAPGEAPYTRGAAPVRDRFLPWDIRAPIPGGTANEAAKTAIAALEGGASSLTLRLGQGGVSARNADELAAALNGVRLDLAGVWLFDGGLASAALLAAHWENSGAKPADIKGGFGLSPIALGALSGAIPEGWEAPLAEAVKWASEQQLDLKTIAVRADLACEAGGTSAQEIAWMAAEAAEYFRALIGAGIAPETAAKTMEIRFAVDSDVHENIAKLRAARRVFSQVAAAFGADAAPHIHAITARRMMSAKDAWTNLLRTTAAAFAGAAGGADAITVRPLTEAAGDPTAFALRLARNIQIMLAEESHMGRVQDPAGGAFLHETLSNEIAKSAWSLFQQIEAECGLSAALKSGFLQSKIGEARDARFKRYENGDILLGLNKYPSDFDEPATGDTAPPPEPHKGDPIPETGWKVALEAAKSGGVLPQTVPRTGDFDPVKPIRWAEAFNG